jgi:hypothetical protein
MAFCKSFIGENTHTTRPDSVTRITPELFYWFALQNFQPLPRCCSWRQHGADQPPLFAPGNFAQSRTAGFAFFIVHLPAIIVVERVFSLRTPSRPESVFSPAMEKNQKV